MRIPFTRARMRPATKPSRFSSALLTGCLAFFCAHAAQANDYHPLKSTQTLTTVTHDLEVVDAERDRTLPICRKKAPNPNHHRVILALSQALWDAHLSDNPDAKNWLDGQGAKSVLEAKDRWLRK